MNHDHRDTARAMAEDHAALEPQEQPRMCMPMHRLTPAEHAAMGWSHGQYKDGYCLALMSHDGPDEVDKFRQEATDRGAKYVALWNLPEYMP